MSNSVLGSDFAVESKAVPDTTQSPAWCPHFDQPASVAHCSICGRPQKKKASYEITYSPRTWLIAPVRPHAGPAYRWNPWSENLTEAVVPLDAKVVHICGAISRSHILTLMQARPNIAVIEIAPSQENSIIAFWRAWLKQNEIGLAVGRLSGI